MTKAKILKWIIPIVLIISMIRINYISMAANGQTIEDGTYTIISAKNTNYVLDVSGGSTSNGANIQIYVGNKTEAQNFKLTYSNGYYKIVNQKSGKVLDVAGGKKTSGTNVQQYVDNGTDAQKWSIQDAGNGYYYIVSKLSGMYLDIQGGTVKNGGNIQVYVSNKTEAQKFKFQKSSSSNSGIEAKKTVDDGTYVIRSAKNTSFVLDISGASKSDHANVQIWGNGSVSQQRFKLTYSNGYYKIVNENSGKVLDVSGGSKASGANVQQYVDNGTDAQKWAIQDAGNGYYYIVSKLSGMYLDVQGGTIKNGANIQVYVGNKTEAQKFKFEKYTASNNNNNNNNNNSIKVEPKKTISDGTYTIGSVLNTNYVLDISGGSTSDGANVQTWWTANVSQQRFNITYLGDGYYKIISVKSGKALDVAGGNKASGTNVQQYSYNGTDAQKWVIQDAGNGNYYIVSKLSSMFLDVSGGTIKEGANIQVYTGNRTNAQKFKFNKVSTSISLDSNKYPGYKEKLQSLKAAHPNWNFEFLYTGLKFSDAVSGEYSVRSRNLVPTDYSGEWISGTTLYDSGWYAASEKAIAYYMDPRNFLDTTNIFQFLNVNNYSSESCTYDGIKSKVSGTFLANYTDAINNACRNKNVNPYYIIARLIQEQGTKGTTIGTGMNGGDGKTYYNPFNIGASGNGYSQIYANALKTAKSYGWDTMQKALEGGINFCKVNWLDNYQNTLYQNRFDIDKTNGTSLYSHQYMQNLMGAYSEAQTLYSMYNKTGKVDSSFTFIIPLYEGLDGTVSPMPQSKAETYAINVKTTGTNVYIRKDASTSSAVLRTVGTKGTVLLSVQRGVNSGWQKVITQDGLIGYISDTYVTQVDDVKTCNYTAKVKTNDGDGCYVRIGPSTNLDRIKALSDGTQVTVIDDSTYKNINGYNWSRVVLSNGTQAFMPSNFLSR